MKLATTIIALLSTWVVAAAAKQEKVSVDNLLITTICFDFDDRHRLTTLMHDYIGR
jgi:hypothetical protein